MTEAEWLAASDPTPIVKYMRRKKASPRKWRLVIVGCARKIWGHLTEREYQNAIEAAEHFADGKLTKEELAVAHQTVYSLYENDPRDIFDELRDAGGVAAGAAMSNHGHAFNRVIWRMNAADVCPLLRDVFGNPFRPVVVDPSWRSSTVVGLAEAIYAQRAFDRLPILADALEETGCDHADILAHCRGPGSHVRGCWVVDLLTGRS